NHTFSGLSRSCKTKSKKLSHLILQYDFRTKRSKESVITSSKKIVPVHPATNGRRLAEPILPAARSSPPLGEATPRRLLAAQARGSSRPAGHRARPQPARGPAAWSRLPGAGSDRRR